MLGTDNDADKAVPIQYLQIVRATLDLKNELDFGLAYNRSQATYAELLGVRAYQRASNKVQADENERIRQANQNK